MILSTALGTGDGDDYILAPELTSLPYGFHGCLHRFPRFRPVGRAILSDCKDDACRIQLDCSR